MTVAVAVQKGGRTVVAADSLVHFGGQRCPPDNCRFRKIHEFGGSLIVCAGWTLYTELLTAYCAQHGMPDIDGEAGVFDFFLQFWRSMKADFTLVGGAPGDGDHPFADLDSVFLMANAQGIYRIGGDLDVTYFQRYAAIGSGSKYALGALGFLYDQLDDPAEIARLAAQAGIDNDVYCGGPIDLVEVPLEMRDERRRPQAFG